MHIGLYCPAETGHLNTMLPIGEALKKQGHQVTFIGLLDAEKKVTAANLDFYPVGCIDFPEGSTEIMFSRLGKLEGISALLYTVQIFRDLARNFLKEGAIAYQNLKLDGLVIDQITIEGAAIAESLQLPFVTICSALPFNSEAAIPPVYTTWLYQDIWWAKLRNQLIHRYVSGIVGKFSQQLARNYRKQHNLPLRKTFDSPLAILCQEPLSLEFPRKTLPPHFHFTGPFHSVTSRKKVDFPWDKLSGKTLIYASMGTLQNGLENVFKIIAEACTFFDIQLVISLGGSAYPNDLTSLVGQPIVVHYAPQIELLQKAALTITHAGMNTTLESLTYGVPLVAIPVTNDQPAIAARIKWSGVGEFIPVKQLNVLKLKQAIQSVLETKSYRENAQRIQTDITNSGGVEKAVKIIEQALETKQPVIF